MYPNEMNVFYLRGLNNLFYRYNTLKSFEVNCEVLNTKSILLVVDLQRGFLNQNTERVLNVINEAKRLLHYEICVYTKFFNSQKSSFTQILNWTKFQSGYEQELVLPVEDKDIVLSKNSYSAVTVDLKELIEKGQFDNVYLCGVDTDSCVLATAFELFDLGINPAIIIDACASSGGDSCHAAAELIMRRSFGNDNVKNLSHYIGGKI